MTKICSHKQLKDQQIKSKCFQNNILFLLVITVSGNVPWDQRIYKNGPCSCAAVLSCPVGDLDVTCVVMPTMSLKITQTVTVQSAAVTPFSVTLKTCSFHLLECCCTSLSFLILLAPPILLFNVITLHVGLLFAFFTDFTSDSVYAFTSVLSNCPSSFFHYYYWPLLHSTILCPQADSPRSCRKWFWMSDCSLFMACIFYFNIHWNVVVN